MAYNNFTLETDSDGIALITWDMADKSMNVFTMEVMDELDAIVDQVAGDEAIKGAVITSGKSTFSGGADITMLNGMYERFDAAHAQDEKAAVQELFDNAGKLSWIFRKLETCGKPFVSAINGTCMGGATELSLACHARLGTDAEGWKMALPEVKIGIFPGAGGTVRVPRLV
ncbi:MAG: enoyl-CoA hydratase-related protein, partial [Pseudomonadota bacterium]